VSALAVIQTVLKTELMEAISRNKIDFWVRKTGSYIEQLEAELKEERLQHSFTKIHFKHEAVLLKSCEEALKERDEKLMKVTQ
jgi:hypothetical protein